MIPKHSQNTLPKTIIFYLSTTKKASSTKMKLRTDHLGLNFAYLW